MNLPTPQIRMLLAPVYRDACLNADVEMKQLAELLEYLAERFENENPHTVWQRIDIDHELYDRPAYRNYLVNLKKKYFEVLAEAIESKIHTLCSENMEQAFKEWEREYFDALVYWNSIVYFRLCSARFNFDEDKQNQIKKYQEINTEVFDSRWDQVYPFYCEQAANMSLSVKHRSRFAVYAGQMQLYHLLPDNDAALHHFQEAKNLYSEAYTEQAFGEYHLKLSECEKARNYFMQALSMDPADIENYLFVGDSYRNESQFDTAEQWYNDALNMNFMEQSVYKRLLSLYGKPEYEGTKKEEMHRLVEYTEEIVLDHPCRDDRNDLYRAAADAFYGAGDLGEAENYYRQAVNHQPDLIQAYIDLGYILTFAEKFEEAIQVFEKAAKLGEPLFDVYWGQAYTYEQMKNFEQVVECYKKCSKLLPSRAETIKYNLALAYKQIEAYEDAKKIYKELISEHPKNGRYVDDLQDLLVESNETDELEKLLTELIEKEPGNNLHYNNLGNLYFEQGDYERAIPQYLKATELDETEAVQWENLGRSYENLKQYHDAEKAYLRAAELDDQTGRYFNRLGVFYNNTALYSQAVPYYKKALEREPGRVLYLSNLGIAYSWLEEYDNAVQAFNDVLKVDPDNIIALTECASALIKLDRLDRYEEAKFHLNKLIELEPQKLDHIRDLGFVYQKLGDYSGALAAYQKALKIESNSDFYHNQAGVMHYWLGDLEQAKAHYNQAIQNNPNVQLYYSNLGLVLDDLNEKEAAREAYAKSEQLAEASRQTNKY